MKCLETRKTAEGWTRRRYERDDGTRVTTLELPLTVIKNIGTGKLRAAAAKFNRGEAARQRAARVREAIAERIATIEEKRQLEAQMQAGAGGGGPGAPAPGG